MVAFSQAVAGVKWLQSEFRMSLDAMFRSLTRYLVVMAAGAILLVGQTDFADLDKSATQELAKYKIPGASIAVVRAGRVVYLKAFGTADLETGESMRPEMLARIGSTSKMFTAAALVGLAVEGKIDLNAPVGTYLKFLPPRLSQATANQLLSHTAGIHDEAPQYGSHDDSALGAGIHAWTDNWLFAAPGKIVSYSNPGYWLAGFLVETLTGMPYADAMEARVFKPLGMTRTTLRPTTAMTWPQAQGHESGKVVRPAADNAATWPAGSIFSNTSELSRFVIAFMNQGVLDGKQLLDPKVIALMSTPHIAVPGGIDTYQSYCYGLNSGEYRGVRFLEHNGERTGYGSLIRMIPERRVAVIVVTNQTGENLPQTAERALELATQLAPKAPDISEVAQRITQNDIARVTGNYQNGAGRLEIFERDHHLYSRTGTKDVELIKYSESSYQAGRSRLIMIPGEHLRTEYVFFNGRAFARVE
jgi:CubicO group peptidase (beta-lactamase class C family)